MFTMKADTDVERSFPAMEFEHFVIAVIRNPERHSNSCLSCLTAEWPNGYSRSPQGPFSSRIEAFGGVFFLSQSYHIVGAVASCLTGYCPILL